MTKKTGSPGRSRRGTRGSGAGRAGRLALRIAAGVFLLALVLAAAASFAMHRILVTGKVKKWVSSEPEKLRLEYASASGWFPWAVRVRGLELRSRDPNVEWWFSIDDARFSFSPLALLGRRFHVTKLRGTGFQYRLRVRAAPPEASAGHMAALPEIPGFGARPKPPPEEAAPTPNAPQDPDGAPSAPASATAASDSHPFRIQIDDLSIDAVREVWIDIYRYAGGTGSVTGSFSLHPPVRARIGPARVRLEKGDLTLGRDTISRGGSFEAGVTIREFDPRLVRGDAVWPYISGKASLDGPLGDLAFLNHFIGGEPRLSGGAGALRFALDVEKGRGTGAVSLDARNVAARYKEASIRGRVGVAGRIVSWDMEKNAIDLSGTRIELKDISSGGAPGPDSRNWWGRFDLKTADVKPGRAAAFRTQVAVKCRDARPLFTLFEVGLPGWARGVLELEGLDASAKVGLGKNTTELEDLDASGGGFRVRGRYRDRPSSKRGAFLLEKGVLAVGLEIEGPKSSLKLLGARAWFAGQPAEAATSPPRR
ncbi:MAG: hypothetical protein ABI592_12510 [Acidobacteriota bacterium]